MDNGVLVRILALVLNGGVKAQYDNRIISEYIAILSRKEFCFYPEIIRNLIGYFRSDGEYLNSDIEHTQNEGVPQRDAGNATGGCTPDSVRHATCRSLATDVPYI